MNPLKIFCYKSTLEMRVMDFMPLIAHFIARNGGKLNVRQGVESSTVASSAHGVKCPLHFVLQEINVQTLQICLNNHLSLQLCVVKVACVLI